MAIKHFHASLVNAVARMQAALLLQMTIVQLHSFSMHLPLLILIQLRKLSFLQNLRYSECQELLSLSILLFVAWRATTSLNV